MTIEKVEKDTDVLSFIREVQLSKPSDHVVEQLLKLITTGMLKPGDLLPPERDLTQKFGISRNYVREGIKTLELYGLLKPIQGRGTVVTDSGFGGLHGMLKMVLKLTRGDLLALVDTRILLETETARLAAEHIDDEGRAQLAACMTSCGVRAEAGAGLMSDIRLHITIADLSRNSVMASLIRLVTPDIIFYYRDFRNDDTPRTLDVHQRIVDSIVAGDSEGAVKYMTEHLRDSKRNFTEALERRKSVRTSRKTQ